MGFGDPLVNCLRLQRYLLGIKPHQGPCSGPRQPITGDLMKSGYSSLNLHDYGHAVSGGTLPRFLFFFFFKGTRVYSGLTI